MGKKDPRVDAYIAKSPEFARPVLKHLRGLVHRGCPGVVEEIKWGVPQFTYGGKLFCGMAAFREHCAFGFWNRALGLGKAGGSAGQFGRIAKKSDLPADAELLGYVRKAKELADAGVIRGPERRPKKALPVPPALTAALKKKSGALAKFKEFSDSQRREYSEWIAEAKTDATRDRRVAQAAAWIAEGKTRMWKYR